MTCLHSSPVWSTWYIGLYVCVWFLLLSWSSNRIISTSVSTNISRSLLGSFHVHSSEEMRGCYCATGVSKAAMKCSHSYILWAVKFFSLFLGRSKKLLFEFVFSRSQYSLKRIWDVREDWRGLNISPVKRQSWFLLRFLVFSNFMNHRGEEDLWWNIFATVFFVCLSHILFSISFMFRANLIPFPLQCFCNSSPFNRLSDSDPLFFHFYSSISFVVLFYLVSFCIL